jgi:hypothetical protein
LPPAAELNRWVVGTGLRVVSKALKRSLALRCKHNLKRGNGVRKDVRRYPEEQSLEGKTPWTGLG